MDNPSPENRKVGIDPAPGQPLATLLTSADAVWTRGFAHPPMTPATFQWA